MGEVDPAFIQAEEHRPKLTFSEAESIPLIDLSVLINSPETPNPTTIEPLVAEIEEACRTWGFFQIINHGVPLEVRQKIELASKRFFALPVEEKRKVKRDDINPLGYYDTELTKNVRDWKEVFDAIVKDPTFLPASPEPGDESLRKLVNRWPDYPPEFRKAFEEYAKEMEKLSYRLLELVSLSLGLPANRLSEFFDRHTSRIRLNHYPPCPIPHLALGVGRHKDGGALTILAQDEVGGLEVKRKADEEWIRVRPTPDAYIVNVGDIIQVWSNDKYESVEHRVIVNSEKERFSLPFFFDPDHTVMVEPLKELKSKQSPAKYRAYNWGKFSANRRRSNFMKLDVENIQIYHFRINEEAS
ncbi:Flavanone 3-dioxygenase [Bertholletia excelsa]